MVSYDQGHATWDRITTDEVIWNRHPSPYGRNSHMIVADAHGASMVVHVTPIVGIGTFCRWSTIAHGSVDRVVDAGIGMMAVESAIAQCVAALRRV